MFIEYNNTRGFLTQYYVMVSRLQNGICHIAQIFVMDPNLCKQFRLALFKPPHRPLSIEFFRNSSCGVKFGKFAYISANHSQTEKDKMYRSGMVNQDQG